MSQAIKVIGFVGLAFGVASAQVSDKPDPWYSSPGSAAQTFFFSKKKVDVFPVVGSLQPEAQAALATVPVLPLTRSQSEQYTGRAGTDTKKHYFLARAVICNPGGGFDGAAVGAELGIFHSALGGSSTVERRAVVVALEFTPTALYSWCAVAQ